MVELHAKVNQSGLLYIPKEIRESFGSQVKILTDATAALFFPENADYEDILVSLDILRQDLEHRESLKQKQLENSARLQKQRSSPK